VFGAHVELTEHQIFVGFFELPSLAVGIGAELTVKPANGSKKQCTQMLVLGKATNFVYRVIRT
jgi:hypothetical protein